MVIERNVSQLSLDHLKGGTNCFDKTRLNGGAPGKKVNGHHENVDQVDLKAKLTKNSSKRTGEQPFDSTWENKKQREKYPVKNK